MRRRYLQGISANILLLGVVSFLNDLSSEMIILILPMFITALGGTGLIMGLIGGLQESIASILKVLSGYWSDRVGRMEDICHQWLFDFSHLQIAFSFFTNMAAHITLRQF